jgi:fructose-1-phosphate kinase PfkB-like protein
MAVDTSGADLVTALAAAPWLAKVNAGELGAAFNENAEVAWQDGRDLASEPLTLIVTFGSRGARVWSAAAGPFEVQPPRIDVVNPLAAGDAFMAGLLATMEADGDLAHAVGIGMGWAADVVSRMETELDAKRATYLAAMVKMRPYPPPSSLVGNVNGGANGEA